MKEGTLPQRVAIALSQAKSLRRDAGYLVQALANIRDELEDLQSNETQGEDNAKDTSST